MRSYRMAQDAREQLDRLFGKTHVVASRAARSNVSFARSKSNACIATSPSFVGWYGSVGSAERLDSDPDQRHFLKRMDEIRRLSHWVPSAYLSALTNDGTADGLLTIYDREQPGKVLVAHHPRSQRKVILRFREPS